MRPRVAIIVALIVALTAPAVARPRTTAQRLDHLERLLVAIAVHLGIDEVSLEPEPPPSGAATRALAEAEAAFERANFAIAAQQARRALSLGAGDRARRLLAVTLFRLGRYQDAAVAARARLDRGHLTPGERRELEAIIDASEPGAAILDGRR